MACERQKFVFATTAREQWGDCRRSCRRIRGVDVRKPLAAPPGVPADRAQALQKAFMAANADPEYIQEAKKLGIDISPIDGTGVMAILDRLSQSPPELLEFMKEREKPTEGGG